MYFPTFNIPPIIEAIIKIHWIVIEKGKTPILSLPKGIKQLKKFKKSGKRRRNSIRNNKKNSRISLYSILMSSYDFLFN